MSMIFEDETAETEAERTRDFSGISSQDPQAESERAFEIEVGQQAAGMRIDSYLTEEIEDAARSYIQRLIEEGRIAVQGRPKTAKNYKLRAGGFLLRKNWMWRRRIFLWTSSMRTIIC